MKRLLLTAFLIFNASFAFSDTGCMLAGGDLHSPKPGTALLHAMLIPFSLGILVNVYDSPQISTSPSNCPGWANNISYTGNKCATTTILGTGLLSLYVLAANEGDEVTYDFVECTLDQYTYLLCLSMGVLGLVIIRKRNKP